MNIVSIISKKESQYRKLIEQITEKVSTITRKTHFEEELSNRITKVTNLLKNDPLVTSDKEVITNLSKCLEDLDILDSDVDLKKNEHYYEIVIVGVLEFLDDPLYNTYYQHYDSHKINPFDSAERNIRVKITDIEKLVDQGIAENLHNQRKAKEMFAEMKTLSSKSLRFKQLHLQISNIDKNNKRYESKMKMLYTLRDNYNFLLEIILNIKETGVNYKSTTGKEIMAIVKKLANNVNVSNFKETATKLSLYIKKQNESLIVDESIVSSLSDEIYDQEIDITSSFEEFAEYEDESNEDILDKIKNQYSMLDE